ncbi:hypothetical protein PENTCL1PPCAC_16699, partial [Pristionchus entomophagus]
SSLSPLERLSRESIWQIIECVPESVFALRLVRCTLSDRVNNSIVADKSISPFSSGRVRSLRSRIMNVDLYIPKRKSMLFELSLKLRRFPIKKLIKSIRNVQGVSNHSNVAQVNSDDSMLENLGLCMGVCIEKTELNIGHE